MNITQREVNEQLVLGSIINSPELRSAFVNDVSPDDFISSNHKNIIHGITEVINKKLTFSIDTITTAAIEYNTAVPVDRAYVQYLFEFGKSQNISVDTFKYHLSSVRNKTIINSIAAEDMAAFTTELQKPEADPSALLKAVNKVRDKLLYSRIFSEDVYPCIGGEVLKWRQTTIEERKNEAAFVPIGYSHIDFQLTEGLAAGKVSVIAGRPGCGKSSFACNIMHRISTMSMLTEMDSNPNGILVSPFMLKKPVPVALCALEMNRTSTIDRLASIITGVPLTDIVRNPGRIDRSEFGKIDDFVAMYSSNRYMYVDDKPRQSVSILAQRIASLKRRIKAESMVVFVDLFGRLTDMNIDVEGTTSAAYETALIEIQRLAVELNVHFCLVAQIGRGAEAARPRAKGGNKPINNRPSLNHLKHSGGFEEIPDLIFLLYRPKYYDDTITSDLCEVNVAKQRQGAMNRVINLLFDPPTTALRTTNLVLPDQSGLGLTIVDESYFPDKTLYYSELSLDPETKKPIEIEQQPQTAVTEERGANESTIQHTG